MKKFFIILLAISLCLMVANITLAAETKGKATTTTKVTTKTASNGGNLGIGWYDTSTTYGLSLNYKLNNTLSVQGILAPLGWQGFYGAKANYKFLTPDPSIGVYGYGMAGLTNYYWSSGMGLGFGAGAGAEWFPGKMFDLGNANYKKVGFMLELGFSNMIYNHDYYYYDDVRSGFGLSINAGAHYYF